MVAGMLKRYAQLDFNWNWTKHKGNKKLSKNWKPKQIGFKAGLGQHNMEWNKMGEQTKDKSSAMVQREKLF